MFDANPDRHRCRNLRCKIWLKEPVANPRDAFCCASCEAGFYRTHCRVCEKERRALCRDGNGRALGPLGAALDLLAEGKP